MIAADASALAQLASGVRGIAWLCELDFASGTIRFTTAPMPITSAGFVYAALGTLVEVGSVQESADSASERLTLGFTVVNSAMLTASIGDPATYRGRPARLHLQLFDATFQPVGAKVSRWQGYMDKVQISRTPAPEGGGEAGGRIDVVCSRAGMARARNAEGLRHTDAQQQSRFPGDTGLRYVRTLVEKPTLWLSKKFQEI